MLNNSYNKNTLEAVTQGSKVGGYPSKFLSLLKTTLFIIFFNFKCYGDLTIDPDLYNDNIDYKTNLVIEYQEFSKKKTPVEEVELKQGDSMHLDIPECNVSKAELLNKK
jgi:hypothetical protein